MKLTAIIEREGTSFVALCPELDIASQGEDIPTARMNLQEAVALFFECAPLEDVQCRFSTKSDLLPRRLFETEP